MPEITKIEPSIKNKKAIEVSKKMGKRYSLLDAMMMGRRLGIDWTKEKFTVGDLLVGMHYELEHGKVDPETNVTNDSPKKTAKVAWAHLKERPDYYVQLMKMDPPHKLEKKASESSPLKKAFKGYTDVLLGKNMKKSEAKRALAKAIAEDRAAWHDKQSDLFSEKITNARLDIDRGPRGVLKFFDDMDCAVEKAQEHNDAAAKLRIKALDMPTGPAAKERLKTYGTRTATAAALAAGAYGTYKGIKKLSDKRKKKQTEKIAHTQLNEMVKEATPRWRKEWENLSWSARNRLRDNVASPTNEAARKSRREFVTQMRNAEDFTSRMKASADKTRRGLQDAKAAVNAISKKSNMSSGQFASEMQNKSNAFMSSIKAKKPAISTDEHMSKAISDAKASAIEKATAHGTPEYKAMRNNENLKGTINRKTEAALNKNRVEDSLKAFDKQFGRKKVKMGKPAQDAASKVYSYTEGGAKAYLDKQVAAANREKLIKAGGKALAGAGIAAAGIGAYKALKKRKENKQRTAAAPVYNYPQPYPQMMQHTACSLLDSLYLEKLADDNADLKEQIPNLVLEAKHKPEIKKQKTPGGKVTPSKYVQRKNKQRYNA